MIGEPKEPGKDFGFDDKIEGRPAFNKERTEEDIIATAQKKINTEPERFDHGMETTTEERSLNNTIHGLDQGNYSADQIVKLEQTIAKAKEKLS
ncbi:MAG: hypothetical protein ABH884_03555 [Candidatus Komeilibacteria bacterium]